MTPRNRRDALERPDGSSVAEMVLVRCCAACHSDDLRATFGRRAVLDARPWTCPACGAPHWVARERPLPLDVEGAARCSHDGAGS